MGRVVRKSIRRTLQETVERFRREKGREPVTADEIADYAIEHDIRAPRPTEKKLLSQLIADAMKHERVTDPQGRVVRRWHAVRDGDAPTLWDEIDTIKPPMMRASMTARRADIAKDCFRAKLDQDSYNDNNRYKAKLPPLDLNFHPDVEEMEASDQYPDAAPEEDEEDDGQA